ncbi:hypothetical protein PHMEG_0007565 [Phytophthora megakarya]|uniref:Reverse transcriptase n=1 Tax=Phytophthora megakarya TaxID=4795 RepID=A0A225WN71_9STRA|nr:hypothetical protein PHMEG_0007565 [Phytophthora megakarya]
MGIDGFSQYPMDLGGRSTSRSPTSEMRIGIWLDGDHVPRLPGFISIGSRRYMEWQNLALEATVGVGSGDMESETPPRSAVERSEYKTLRAILQRPKTTSIKCRKVKANEDQGVPAFLRWDNPPSDKSPSEIPPLNLVAFINGDYVSHVVTVKEVLVDQVTPEVCGTDSPLVGDVSADNAPKEEDRDETEVANQDQLRLGLRIKEHTVEVRWIRSVINDECTIWDGTYQPEASNSDLTWDSDQDYDECVYYHEGSDLYAEDVDGQMAVLPEVPMTTVDVKIEDIQPCKSDNQTSEEIDRLRQGSGSSDTS